MYYEHAPKVFVRNGTMVDEDVLPNLRGFSSLYGFSAEDAEKIRVSGKSRGFSEYAVYSDRLVWDLDQGYDGVEKLKAWAKERDLAYELWESGGKGYHFIVPTVPVYAQNLPFTHREITASITPSDPSIYRHGSLFRLPGTIHEKTQRTKTLVEQEKRRGIAKFSLQTPPERKWAVEAVEDGDQFRFSLINLVTRFGVCPGVGGRYLYFWKTAKDLCEAGVSADAAVELLGIVNESWGKNAKDESEIERAVKGAYK